MILFLNDLGTGEVLLVLAFILIFFGSKSIPGLARTFGQTIRKVKDASTDLKSEIRKSGMNIKAELDISDIVRETAQDIKTPLDQYASDVEDVISRRPVHSHPKAPVAPKKVEEGEVKNEPTKNGTASSKKVSSASSKVKKTKPGIKKSNKPKTDSTEGE